MTWPIIIQRLFFIRFLSNVGLKTLIWIFLIYYVFLFNCYTHWTLLRTLLRSPREDVLMLCNKHLQRFSCNCCQSTFILSDTVKQIKPCSLTCVQLISSSHNVLSQQLRNYYGRYVMKGLIHHSALVPPACICHEQRKWEYMHVYRHMHAHK